MWPSWLRRQIVALKIVGSSPIIHPMKKGQAVWLVLFSVKSTLRVGEIPLRGVKSGLRPGEIAEAAGGFPFTESRRLSISPKAKPLASLLAKQQGSCKILNRVHSV